MRVPQTITHTWIGSLNDTDLVDAEARLHGALGVLERREKRALGERYELLRGPADLLLAWDRWTRVSQAARLRGLRLRRVRAA